MATATGKRPYAPRLPPAERREQLLDAALELIAERGYGGVSMEGVARAAGVTKPVVYDGFTNVDALLRALLEREETRAFAQLAEAMPADPTAHPDELAVAGFVAFLHSVSASPTTWRLILMPVEGTPAAVRDHVDAGREAIRGQLAELVAWGVEERGGPHGLDLELSAQSLVALGEHLARLTLTQPQRFTPERAGEFVRTLLAALDA